MIKAYRTEGRNFLYPFLVIGDLVAWSTLLPEPKDPAM
jgi:hypothetical protein